MSNLGNNIDDLDPEKPAEAAPAPAPAPAPTVAKSPTPKAKKASAPEVAGVKTMRIQLEDNDAIPPGGLFVSHNGRPYLIPVGVDVDVPLFIIDLLNDAVISAPVIDKNTRRISGWRDRLRYPYRVVST